MSELLDQLWVLLDRLDTARAQGETVDRVRISPGVPEGMVVVIPYVGPDGKARHEACINPANYERIVALTADEFSNWDGQRIAGLPVVKS